MNILIIEDDPMVAQIQQEFCYRIDKTIETTIARTLSSGKDLLTSNDFDVILLDNSLPDGKGIDILTLEHLTPVIMITAANDLFTVKQALLHGVIDYLVKPFTFERFKKSINKVSEYYQLMSYATVTQNILDDYLFIEQGSGISINLPKGISKVTLKKITDSMMSQNAPFTTQQISNDIMISRITIKKYLKYLVEKGYLIEDARYLEAGRPLSVYTVNKLKNIYQLLK